MSSSEVVVHREAVFIEKLIPVAYIIFLKKKQKKQTKHVANQSVSSRGSSESAIAHKGGEKRASWGRGGEPWGEVGGVGGGFWSVFIRAGPPRTGRG